MTFDERLVPSMLEESLAHIQTVSHDNIGIVMTGHHVDRIFKNGVLIDEREGHNIVVTPFLNLVMCLLKRQAGYTGISYWAVGSGAASWDTTPVDPVVGATALTNEIGRVAVGANEMSFLNSNYNVQTAPSNIIQVVHTFGVNDCNGIWREFGLFGGNATSTRNSGIMVNKRHHAIMTKTNEMTVERTMRFTISLT